MLLVIVLFFLFFNLLFFCSNVRLFIEIEEDRYVALLKFYIFNIQIKTINLAKVKKEKEKNESSKILKKLKLNKKIKIKLIKEILSIAKLENFKLQLDISTTDVILTSSIVFILLNIITFILKYSHIKINKLNCDYAVNPLYIDKKIFNIKLNCIINANLAHIIYIIFNNMNERRGDINGRATSNRKSYVDCNE